MVVFLLGYIFYVRVGRIERPTRVWKTLILPLNYTRVFLKELPYYTQKEDK
jgi:hypothetical protein